MVLISHFDYWAFEPAPFWAISHSGVVACDSLWQPNIPPSNGVHSVDALVLYGNAIYFVWDSLFNGIKSDGVTICDAIRRADAFLFLNIRRIIVFSQQTENQHFFDYFEEAPYILTMNRIIVTLNHPQ